MLKTTTTAMTRATLAPAATPTIIAVLGPFTLVEEDCVTDGVDVASEVFAIDSE